MKFPKNQHVSQRAFDEREQEITITPTFIGSRSAYDVAYLLMKSYYVFVKQLPPGATFTFKAEMTFVSNQGGDDYGAHSKVYNKEMLHNGQLNIAMPYILCPRVRKK